jgi:single-strand DNA-binding protein
MARSLNKVMLIGNLGRDPEMRYTPGGEPVVSFSIATTRTWIDQASNERREATDWHNIVAWRRLAETCHRFLRKGSLVYLEGRLETRSWDDRDTGKKMYRTEVILDEMNMLDSRRDSEDGGDMAASGGDHPAQRPSTAPSGSRDAHRDSGPSPENGSSRDRSHLRPVRGGGGSDSGDQYMRDLDDDPF